MKFVAFFRNLNLGQGRSPTRPELEAAFASAGAEDAASFQTAGTVVFSASSESEAETIVTGSRGILLELRGFSEPAYIAPLGHLIGLAASEPLPNNILETNVTLMPRDALARLALPLATTRGDLEIIRITPYVALSLSRRVGAMTGNPTPFFEKLLGIKATTRSWGTVMRLVKKHAAIEGG